MFHWNVYAAVCNITHLWRFMFSSIVQSKHDWLCTMFSFVFIHALRFTIHLIYVLYASSAIPRWTITQQHVWTKSIQPETVIFAKCSLTSIFDMNLSSFMLCLTAPYIDRLACAVVQGVPRLYVNNRMLQTNGNMPFSYCLFVVWY